MKRLIFKTYVLFIIFSSLFYSCKDNTVTVSISASKAPVSRLKNIIEKYPLPEGFRISEDKTEKTEFSLSLKSRMTTLKEASAERTAGQLTERVIISGEWFAPAADFLDFDTDTGGTSYKEENFVPLKSIILPEKALPVNGMFPGNPEYPGFRITELKITVREFPERTQEEIPLPMVQSAPCFTPGCKKKAW